MDKWTQRLSQRIHLLQQRVQSLLESEHGAADPDAPPFEASRDPLLAQSLSAGLPDDHIDRAIVVFNRLSGLFDGGILLENLDGQWKAQAVFHQGTARPLRRDRIAPLRLPMIGPLVALKTPAKPLLAKLQLKDLDPEGKRQAILVKPVPDFAYVLLSSLPDLWLKDHLERVMKALSAGFAE